MPSLNRVTLIGHLGQDPEIKHTQVGTMFANLSVATTEKFKDKNGKPQEKTEWHKIVAWGRLAEICEKYLFKGSLAFIEGKLQTRSWEDRDGAKRHATEVLMLDLKILSWKEGKDSRPSEHLNTSSAEKRDPLDDIPF